MSAAVSAPSPTAVVWVGVTGDRAAAVKARTWFVARRELAVALGVAPEELEVRTEETSP